MKKLIILLFTVVFGINLSYSQDSNVVYIFEIDDEIADPAWHNTQQMFEEVEEIQPKAIVISLNTYGGKVDMADSIRTAILRSEIPVFVMIKNNAASAGALISIACDKIYMTPGSTIGAATVVTQDGAPAIDKYQSYFRSKMRATAEVTGRDPDIAEAMVDQDIEIEGITEAGKLLTFTVQEAIENNYCEKEVSNLNELLQDNEMAHLKRVKYKPTFIDKIIGFLVSPAVSGILIMLMLGGIYFELQSPGIGFPLAAAAVGAVLFFAPLYIEGMAANWEIILFIVGVILLALEILVIPGTGITGIAGVLFILTGLTLSMVQNIDFDFSMVETSGLLSAFSIVLFSMIIMMVGILLLLPKMMTSGRLNKLVLASSQKVEEGYVGVDTSISQYLHKEGVALTDLRPAGKVEIDNMHLDAFSMESYITQGSRIIVTGTDGAQVLVKSID